jgi:hypothetical protein
VRNGRYHAKFRYDAFHVHARVRGHMHVRYDARNRAILRGRFQSDERLSTLGERGSLDEIKLPSRTAVPVAVNELPIDLAVQIDSDGSVHAHQMVVLGDHVEVVNAGSGVTFHGRIVVNEWIDLIIANRECENVFAGTKSLLWPVRYPATYQLHQSVAEQIRVNSQILAIREMQRHGVRQIADSQLNRSAVRNLFGDALSEFSWTPGQGQRKESEPGGVVFDGGVQFRNAHQEIAKHPLHIGGSLPQSRSRSDAGPWRRNHCSCRG